ncbi:MAG: hypothetical protein FWD26_05250 [Treponema sp.]|nr:hypothetical protein [Treponema sp.]
MIKRLTIVVIILSILLLSACDLFAPSIDIPTNLPDGKVQVKFQIKNISNRSIYPDLDNLEIAYYELFGAIVEDENDPPDEELITNIDTDANEVTVPLDPGKWNFTLTAYDDNDNPVLEGKVLNIVIPLVNNDAIRFTLYPINSDNGTIDITFVIPVEAGINFVEVFVNGSLALEEDIANDNYMYYKNNISADDYFTVFKFYTRIWNQEKSENDRHLRITVSEMIHVRGNVSTYASIALAMKDINPIDTQERYVVQNGTGDGSSWVNASGDLQKMIDDVHEAWRLGAKKAIVHVAAGEYKPTYWIDGVTGATVSDGIDPRDKTFILRRGVELRGGYIAGEEIGEADRKDRFNINGEPINENHRVTLSGDFTANDNDKAYHVVLAVNIPGGDATAIVDGFTITGGNANSGDSILVQTNTIQKNRGGGIYSVNSSLVLNNVVVEDNQAEESGGGMYIERGSVAVNNSSITVNNSNNGGGIAISEAESLVITDSVIEGNNGNEDIHSFFAANLTLSKESIIESITLLADSEDTTSAINIASDWSGVIEILNLEGTSDLADTIGWWEDSQVLTGTLNNISGDISLGDFIFSIGGAIDINITHEIAPDGRLVAKQQSNGVMVIQGTNEIPYPTLAEAITNTTGTYTVRILSSPQTLTPTSLSDGTNITLIAGGSLTEAVINLSGQGSMFNVERGASLTLNNGITLVGHSNNNDSLVRIEDGTLTMNAGAAIQNNHTSGDGGGVFIEYGTFNMNGGTISGNTARNGAGIYSRSGVFNMSGGLITNNTSSNGSGVYINSYTESFKVGGDAKIQGNGNNNVYLDGAKTIELDNGVPPPAPGMSIFVNTTGTIVQSGIDDTNIAYFHPDDTGKIKHNFDGQLFISSALEQEQQKFYREVAEYRTATGPNPKEVIVSSSFELPTPVLIPVNANGVDLIIRSENTIQTLTRGFEDTNIFRGLITVSPNSRLILENIIIDGSKTRFPNNASSLVYLVSSGVPKSELTMNNGAILRNNRASMGGGIASYGIVNINGGEITENTSINNGGGILNDYGTLNMTGGKIHLNSGRSGGGIASFNYSIINISVSGGEISGNTATINGGGIYLSSSGDSYTFGGTAKVSGNTSNGTPNNVYLENGVTIMLGDGVSVPVPASGMEVWVRTQNNQPGEIIVSGGASAIDNTASYFYADADGMAVVLDNGSLILSAAAVGTEGNPFPIYDEEGLRKIGSTTDGWNLNSHYRLMKNIPIIPVSEGGEPWTPIGPFAGSLNGSGYAITGLVINSSGGSSGLFSSSSGKVRNLGLVDVRITNTTGGNVGAIAGSGGGTIDNCFVTGSVTSSDGSGQYIGGFVGNAGTIVIKNSYFDGIVSGGSNNVGGFVGSTSGSITITDSFVSANVSGTGNIGGLVGNGNVTISNCYVSGTVKGNTNVGGIAGSATSGTITNCVALNQSVTAAGTTNVGRIIGTGSASTTNNQAWNGMKLSLNGNNYTANNNNNGKDGAHLDDITNVNTWPAVFTAIPWSWTDTTKMPRLASHPAQDWPLYITGGSATFKITINPFASSGFVFVQEPSGPMVLKKPNGDSPTVLSITITYGGEYTIAPNDIKWLVNGEEKGTGFSFDLRAIDYGYGTRFLTLYAIIDGKPHSHVFEFHVEHEQ